MTKFAGFYVRLELQHEIPSHHGARPPEHGRTVNSQMAFAWCSGVRYHLMMVLGKLSAGPNH